MINLIKLGKFALKARRMYKKLKAMRDKERVNHESAFRAHKRHKRHRYS